MNKFLKINILVALLLAALISATSCSQEETLATPQEEEKSVVATFKLNVPEEFVQTRAMSDDSEHKVKSVDVLVFRKDASNKELFYYYEQATLIDGSSLTKEYRASVKQSSDMQKFVVLANVRHLIDPTQLNQDMTRSEVLELLEIEQNQAWNVSDDYDPFPMWGETEYIAINSGSPELSVNMLRSVARVDVNVSSGAQSQFVISEVIFKSAPNVGRVVPDEDKWSELAERVTAPSTPTNGFSRATSAQVYSVSNGKSLTKTIYSLEHSATPSNSDINSPYLLIKGSWNDEADSYYRVDFFNEDDNKFLPILRNHQYDVQIIEVLGSGYPTMAEAEERGFSLMTATTHLINSGDMGSVVWNGRDMLSLSKTSFDIYSEEQSLNIDILTTYEEGWKATIEVKSGDEAEWISVVGNNKGNGGEKGELQLKVKQNSEVNREATVVIIAGRLSQEINVSQSTELPLELELSDIELVFSTMSPQEQEVRLEWIPAAIDCKVELLSAEGYVNNPVTFSGANKLPETVSDNGSSANRGVYLLKLKPDAKTLDPKNPFIERRSILKVTAYDAKGKALSKEATLKQLDYGVSVGKQRSSYDCGTTYALNVKSNALWDVKVSDESMLTITSDVRGQANYDSGEELIFKTKGNTGNVKLTFVSKEGVFNDQVININIERLLPNCYILAPGTSDFSFPITNALKAWGEDVDLKPSKGLIESGTRSVELLWQDEKGLIPSQPTLNGNNIVVSTASGKEGNAVVALKVDGVIRWSWHLWVCDFDPNQNTYTNPHTGAISMDRNLGATSNFAPVNDNDVRSFGLFYQHGRKDPFPGSAKTTGTTTKEIYGIDNSILTANSNGFVTTPVVVEKNLINAIANPLIHYTHTASGEVNSEACDWYTNAITPMSAKYHRDDLWPVDYKYYFDPCPAGWRVSSNREAWDFLEPPEGLANIATDKGVQTPYGYYPAAGRRSYNTGVLQFIGTRTYIYDSFGGYIGFLHYMSNTTFASWSGAERAFGVSVRCVKIQ